MKNCQGCNESKTHGLIGEERARLERGKVGLERRKARGGAGVG